ncbi:hypothetical protein BGX33_000541 [Mortierella sp. NVP41]|nr:hypothetical protein BGX33_000541 [Mortierella sp. NVP41]
MTTNSGVVVADQDGFTVVRSKRALKQQQRSLSTSPSSGLQHFPVATIPQCNNYTAGFETRASNNINHSYNSQHSDSTGQPEQPTANNATPSYAVIPRAATATAEVNSPANDDDSYGNSSSGSSNSNSSGSDWTNVSRERYRGRGGRARRNKNKYYNREYVKDTFMNYVRDVNPIAVPLEDRYDGGSDSAGGVSNSSNTEEQDDHDHDGVKTNDKGENHWIDSKTLVLKDKYPKAHFHVLVMPNRLVPTMDHLICGDGVAIVQQLVERAKIVIARESKRWPHLKFMMGFHALPTMKQVHMHVISTDLDSDNMQRAPVYNSYTTQFFLTPEQVIQRIETKWKVRQPRFLSWKDIAFYKNWQYMTQPRCLHCHQQDFHDQPPCRDHDHDESACHDTDSDHDVENENGSEKEFDRMMDSNGKAKVKDDDGDGGAKGASGSFATIGRNAEFGLLKQHLRMHYLEQKMYGSASPAPVNGPVLDNGDINDPSSSGALLSLRHDVREE